jgi:hypothetical protein
MKKNREATMTEQERLAFYSKIPPMMHHFPHLFVMQQRAAMQQQYQQQQGGHIYNNAAYPTTSSSSTTNNNNIDALKQSGILNLLSSNEGRLKIQDLSRRIQEKKNIVENSVSDWNEEKKIDFLTSFIDHPLVNNFKVNDNDDNNDNSSASNPIDKITAFLNMSEEDLHSLLTLQFVVSSDESGELIKNVFSTLNNNSNSNEIENKKKNEVVLQGFLNTLQTLSNIKTRPSQQLPSNDGHNHSHANHDETCPHHGYSQQTPVRDVSSGVTDKMDR